MKNLKKLFALMMIFSCSQIFSLSVNEENYIQKILDFRLSLRKYSSADEAIQKIKEFELQEKNEMNSLGEEAGLVAENMLVTAHYNCEYEKDVKSKALEGILRPTFEKILSFKERNKTEEISNIFLISSADVINSMMQFLPQTNAIKYGLLEKKEYALVLERDPKMSLGLINSALWYYFAPAFGGGSKKKAEVFFVDANRFAKNDYEKYYSAIYLSQFYFEQKNFSECETYLAAAEKLLPNTRYVPFIRKINSLGFSLYDFNNNSSREKVLKKLGE